MNRKRDYNKTYTEEQKLKIEKLGAKGVRDVDISKIVGLHYSIIHPITTKYWENKMKLKNE